MYPIVTLPIPTNNQPFDQAMVFLRGIYGSDHYCYFIAFCMIQRYLMTHQELPRVIDDILENTEIDDLAIDNLTAIEYELQYNLQFVINSIIDFYRKCNPQLIEYLIFLERNGLYLDIDASNGYGDQNAITGTITRRENMVMGRDFDPRI